VRLDVGSVAGTTTPTAGLTTAAWNSVVRVNASPASVAVDWTEAVTGLLAADFTVVRGKTNA
jgi:hypothetical protein